MPDRSKAPALQQITNLNLIPPVVHTLDNGIIVHEVNMGTQDVLKLEVIFRAGRWLEDTPLAARATGTMLKEGTGTMTSAQIAEHIDFYGASIHSSGGLDTGGATVYCLTRHLEKILPVLQDILTQPVFPQAELDTFIEQRCQQLGIEATKPEVIAYRELTAALFGKSHPYGYNSTPDLYRTIKREALIAHFKKQYNSQNCLIMLSGKPSPDSIGLLNKYLGQLPYGESHTPTHHIEPHAEQQLQFELPNVLQSAIRIGRRWVSRRHPDYPGLFVLNTLLGGYFGSRLMSNIREDKGYTYGIYSSMDMMLHDSYFYIGTEVGTEVTQATVAEIYKELELLQKEPVGKEELERLRNYMLGNLLATLDGPFSVAQASRSLLLEKLDFSFFDTIVNAIKTVQPDELQALAQKYFKREDMTEVIVG